MRVATRVRLHSAKPVRRILPPKFTLDNLNSLLSRRLYVSSRRFVSICVELRTGFLLPTSPCDLHDWTGDRVDWRTSSFCTRDRKSTRLNSSHVAISYAVFCLKKKTQYQNLHRAFPHAQ